MAIKLAQKLYCLKQIVAGMGSVVVAYSGGTDSTLLLKIVSQVLKKKDFVVVVVDSAFLTREEVKSALKLAKGWNIRVKLLKCDVLSDPVIRSNPRLRCYFCKKKIMRNLVNIRKSNGFGYVIDGSNADDFKQLRPGKRALRELGVRSPLAEARLNKSEIRVLARRLKLTNWAKPASSCLATRFPYGVLLKRRDLLRVAWAERLLKGRGFKQVRVRVYGKLARIEVEKEKIKKLAGIFGLSGGG